MKRRSHKHLPLPDHLVIRGVPLRLRYFAMMGLMVIFLTFVFAILPQSEPEDETNLAELERQLVEETEEMGEASRHEQIFVRSDQPKQETARQFQPVEVEEKADMDDGDLPLSVRDDDNGRQIFQAAESVHTTLPNTKPNAFTVKAIVKSGDTLVDFLTRHHLSTKAAYGVIEAFREMFNPRSVKADDVFFIELARNDETQNFNLVSLEYQPSITQLITVVRKPDGGYVASKDEKAIVTKEKGLSFDVESSLYLSANAAGVPDHVIMDLIYIYSWKLDFQRDIRKGDQVRVLYEAEYTEDGVSTNNYNILFASMNASGKDIEIYRHESADGSVDFYTADGHSVRQGLLKTPIEFGRISSGYGMRHHPISGYSKMHKGIDFAAPTGTKIYAAADGVIDKRYYSSSYGNYIRIKHSGGIQTAYAHMSRFAKNLKRGSSVRQGQVIGYVGTTGRSTGPHLHYEVLKNGRQVNPKAVDLPTQNVLKGKEKQRFLSHVASLQKRAKIMIEDYDVRLASQND